MNVIVPIFCIFIHILLKYITSPFHTALLSDRKFKKIDTVKAYNA